MDEKVFILNVFKDHEGIRISGFERDEAQGPLRNYEKHSVNLKEIESKYKALSSLVNKVKISGDISSAELGALEKTGQSFYDDFLPLRIKNKLNDTEAQYIILDIDERLSYIPWEFFFDGKEFLSLRFIMGRIIRTENEPNVKHYAKEIPLPLKMLILFDPKGDLSKGTKNKKGVNEAEKIFRQISNKSDLVNIDIKCRNIDSSYVRENLRNYNIVHYGGHAEYNPKSPEESGWVLSDKKFKASDIKRLVGGRRDIPYLIFSNACRSGLIEQDSAEDYNSRLLGFAKSLLVSGIKHYIGTFWDIPNDVSSYFAAGFYSELTKGQSIGMALKNTRESFIEKFGKKNITWASYILYGDPTFKYFPTEEKIAEPKEESKEKISTRSTPIASAENAKEEEPNYNKTKKKVKKQKTITKQTQAILLSAAMLLACLAAYSHNNTRVQEQEIRLRQEALREVHKRNEADIESQKQNDVLRLINELETKSRVTKSGSKGKSSASLAFSGLKRKGAFYANTGKDDKVISEILKFIKETGKVKILERSEISKVLSELRLSGDGSGLVSPESRLKTGKIVSARFIMPVTSYWYSEGDFDLYLQIIDTETSIEVYSFKTRIKEATDISVVSRKIAHKIRREILSKCDTKES